MNNLYAEELKIIQKATFTLMPIKNQQAGWLDMFNAITDLDI